MRALYLVAAVVLVGCVAETPAAPPTAGAVLVTIDPELMPYAATVDNAIAEWNGAAGVQVLRRVDSTSAPHVVVTTLVTSDLPANDTHPEKIGYWTDARRGQRLDSTQGKLRVRVEELVKYPPHYVLGVFMHEMGHALGIAHEDAPDSLMYWQARADWVLSDESIAAVQQAANVDRPGSLWSHAAAGDTTQ